jgi:hypothetical protein
MNEPGARAVAVALAAAAVAVAGCATPLERAERGATRAGLEPIVIAGTQFHHRAFASRGDGPDPLVLFIDGDGLPWVRGGTRIASDPSPRHPLALELAARTPGPVLYLGRPCYFDFHAEPGCAARYWTDARYSTAVVASMAFAAGSYARQHGYHHMLLVGFSGGGALAALLGRELPGVVGVVTIAGNLDIDGWTQLHGYLPLAASRNPALEPPLPASIQQWHLVGERDTEVPYQAAGSYLRRVPPDRIWRFDGFDHACCWVAAWPELYVRIRRELQNRA